MIIEMIESMDDDSIGSTSSSVAVVEDVADEEGDWTASDPDLLEDGHGYSQDNHWLSEDHLFELQTSRDGNLKVPPPLKTWKEHHPLDKLPEVMLGKARRKAWDQAKEEINLHQENVATIKLPEGCPTPSSVVERVYHLEFGSTSNLHELFCTKLGLDTEEYLLFMISYFKSSRYKMSIPNLHASDDNIRNIMDAKGYNEIWNKLPSCQGPLMANHFGKRLKER